MLVLQLANAGLYTFPNPVGQLPPGAMTVAKNVVIDKPGVAETRRGFLQYGTALAGIIKAFFPFMGKLLVHHGSTIGYDSDGAGTWIDFAGTFDPPTGVPKIHFTLANQNLYLATANGIYKKDALTTNPYLAGGPKALDGTGTLTGGSGFLNSPSETSYVVVWGYTDANNNVILGNPSMVIIVVNTSGSTKNVSLTFTIPAGVTTSYFYQIYRAPQTNSSSVTPGANWQLIIESNPTAGQITAGQVTLIDNVPDTLLGAYVYTSIAAQGSGQTNDPPPIANDIVTFLGMTMYANCTTRQNMFATVIAVGAPNGLQIGDTVVLMGTTTYTYTGAAANNFAAEQFKIDTSSTVAANIDATTRNLVAAINQDPANTEFYAYYVSGPNQLPGQMLIEARNLSHGVFYLQSNRGGAFAPVVPASGTTYPSTNNQVKNGIYVSKLQQPEAVPLSNLIFVGTGDQAIYRMIALRSAVLVIAQGGVFRITGTTPQNLVVTPFDNTVFLNGIENAGLLNNSAYCFSSQGAVAITESGSQIVSRNVEGDLLQNSAPSIFTNFGTYTFATPYESDRKFILWMQAAASDQSSKLQYVYNWITQSWTTWALNATCALVNPADNRLYFGGTDGFVRQERKAFTTGDYADDQFAATISNVSGTSITLSAGISNAVIGMTLGQGVVNGLGGTQAVISGVNQITGVLTLTSAPNPNFVNGSATLFTPITSTIQYVPLTCGFPTYLKRFSTNIQIIFSQANFATLAVAFNTDMFAANETVNIKPKGAAGWGTFPWGTMPWGVTTPLLQTIPTYLTRNTMWCHWLNVQLQLGQAFQNLACDGITAFYEISSERFR